MLFIDKISKKTEEETILQDFTLTINKGDKIAFVGPDGLAKSTLFQILTGEIEADSGSYSWGVTTTHAYFPKDNTKYFQSSDVILLDWLRQFSKDPDESFIRGFLGRMLFSGEEALKKINVLSGGERVRCMLARMMLLSPNVLLLDEPTNHLDLESITALNNGLISFDGTILFTSHDHQFVQTVANRIIEIAPGGIMDKVTTFDEYITNDDVKNFRNSAYQKQKA